MDERVITYSTDEGGVGQDMPLPRKPARKFRINKEEIAGTAFASIPIIGFLIFSLVPLVMSMIMAFYKMRDFGLVNATYVGFKNFEAVLGDKKFWEAIANTFILGSSTLISQVLALIVAYLLSKKIVGRKIFRMVYFIPYVCSAVAVVLMWKYMFNPNYGIINQMLGKQGEEAINWIGDAKYFPWVVIIISVWGGMGYPIVLYTAALTNVNKETIEAATIDGAGPMRVFWNVVLPAISPTSFFLLVTGIIGALQSFATSNILSADGGPNGSGITIVFYLYRKIFNYSGQMGQAAASSWLLFFIVLIFTIINFVGSKKWVNYD